MTTMFSPPRREKARADASHLPQGDCRYIMLHPEVKGLRCACMGFSLNDRIPGSTCLCGHQGCYHAPEKQPSSVERQEIEALKDKITLLEERLDQERLAGKAELVDRLGRLEESFEAKIAESDSQFKNLYRGVGGIWQNIGQLQKRVPYYDDHIDRLADEQERIRHLLEVVDDASMSLEDRVESLENVTTPLGSTYARSRRRKASTPPSVCPDIANTLTKSEDTSCVTPSSTRLPWHIVTSAEQIQTFRERVASVGSGSQAWTVHISLLPSRAQPFPFEKDTAAYKRCLSRGLHRVIAIPDTDSFSFITTVSDSFSEILCGRQWQPLVARICDAKHLRGLPMLRQLPDRLVGNDYDVDFLRRNCAVTDDSGKICDLYIAMSEDTISWAALREVSRFMDGLEAAWIYDPFLDGHADEVPPEHAPAAGDILPTWSPTTPRQSIKRKECEMTRSSSFGSTTEGDCSRQKLRRQYTESGVEVSKRRAEAV